MDGQHSCNCFSVAGSASDSVAFKGGLIFEMHILIHCMPLLTEFHIQAIAQDLANADVIFVDKIIDTDISIFLLTDQIISSVIHTSLSVYSAV
jgi:hypothetical protein